MSRVVLVSGGRTYSDLDFLFEKLSALHAFDPFSLLITGGAWGADRLAQEWARENKVKAVAYLPRWHVHGRMAGPMRNMLMLDKGRPDLVVIFPGGRGTEDLLKKAREVAARRALSIIDTREERP